jgi:hypothetical protein
LGLRRRHIEVYSSGVDEGLQLVGSDANASLSWTGLRVPTLPTPDDSPESRYLFNLASFHVAQNARARLVGWRLAWTIGTKVSIARAGGAPPLTRVFEQEVVSPFWRFPDGNVSFHLQHLNQDQMEGQQFRPSPGAIVPPLRDVAFRMSDSPALLAESITVPAGDGFYVDLTAYAPPNRGRPLGVPLNCNLAVVHDLRTNWRSHGGWYSLDVPVDGPATISLQASVKQTNPASAIRAAETTFVSTGIVPDPCCGVGHRSFFNGGLPPEEQFLLNFPAAAIIWRVAGSLIFALDE